MDNDYIRIVKEVECSENKLVNGILAFASGGLIGLVSEVMYLFLLNNLELEKEISLSLVFIIWVSFSAILTGLGVFDKIASILKAGVIIPSTGFAHAMTSSAMDSNKEGFITGIGPTIFKLTGSIILYGIVFAIIGAFIKGVMF